MANGDFVYDNETLPNDKLDLYPIPVGADARHYVTKDEWNTIANAILDCQVVLRGGKWHALTEQASDPAPAGLGTGTSAYFWVKTDHTLHFKANGVDKQVPLVTNRQKGRATFNGTQDYIDVTFSTPFADTNYDFAATVAITGAEDFVAVVIRNLATGGFRIEPSQPFSGFVCWWAETA